MKNNWREVLGWDMSQESPLRDKFPNLVHLEGIREIARTVLNNGFLTVAHNIPAEEKSNWLEFFKNFGADKDFLNTLERLFDEKIYYERYPNSEESETAWEEMVYLSRHLDTLAESSGIIEQLMQLINWQ